MSTLGLLRARLTPLLPAFMVGAVGLLGWEAIVAGFGIEEFLLPKPSSIARALGEAWPELRSAGLATGEVAVTGLLAGVVLGAFLALLTTRFGSARRAITPLAVAVNATPIIALAPIFNAWFGITNIRSNQLVVVAVVFFPVFLNTARGLVEVHPNQLELMRSYGASETTTLRRVRIPNALPLFLTSLRLATPLSVIAAIVAEYFGGPRDRIGPAITQAASGSRYDEAWAAIAVASALGLVLFAIVSVIERYAMPWRRHKS